MLCSSSDQESDLDWRQRCFLVIEDVILTRLVPHEHPGPIWRWIFKLPALIYKAGLGWLIGQRILLLQTIGRKTGQPREVAGYLPTLYLRPTRTSERMDV